MIKSFSNLTELQGVFMKRFLKISLCILMAVLFTAGLVACDNGGSSNTNMSVRKRGDVYYLNSYVAEYDEAGNAITSVTVGATDGYTTKSGEKATITEIAPGAFRNNSTLKEVIVSSNVTSIGAGAFAGMTKLEKLVLPFAGSKIDAVNEARLIGYLFGTESYDGGYACTQTVSPATDSSSTATTATYYLPETLNTIEIKYEGTDAYVLPQYSFNGLKVSNVTLSGKIEKIANNAFENSYISAIEIPAEVKVIEANAFANCARLTSVTFANGTKLEEIGKEAFKNFKGLKMELPTSVITIGEHAFDGASLTSVKMLGIKNIAVYAFYNCKDLATVELGTVVEYISIGAFKGCEALTLAGVVNMPEASKVHYSAFDFNA